MFSFTRIIPYFFFKMARKVNSRTLIKYLPISILLVFAALQFILILRHKTPYLSDSYFYKQLYYQMKGDSYEKARKRIMGQVDLKNSDEITRNFFIKNESYDYSFSFFKKRPFYPAISVIISIFFTEYVSLILPIFISYIAIFILLFLLLKNFLNSFFLYLLLALLIAYYPFLDWSTYILTDTIGFVFWIIQLILIYQFINKGEKKFLIYYLVTLGVSFFNREESILMLPLSLILLCIYYFLGKSKLIIIRIRKIAFSTFALAFFYIFISFLLKERNFYETLLYNQNYFGLYHNNYSFSQTMNFVLKSIADVHVAFFKDLFTHHWWVLFSTIAFVGIIENVFIVKKKELMSFLIFSSGIASYLIIFIHPVFSYRYFYPILLMCLFFSVKFIQDFFEKYAGD